MKLQELLEKCKNDHAAYDARNAKANAEYQAIQKAVEQAQQEAETALQANQGEAYTEALHRAEYSQKRAAYKEQAPLWEALNNVLIQGREIISQLNHVADVESRALNHLTATVPYSPNRSEAEYPRGFSRDSVESALVKMFAPYGEAANIISHRLPKKGAK